MKILKITIVMAIFVTNFAYGQQNKSATTTIDAAELKGIKGKDIIINDASLNKYVGTWVWSDGEKNLKIKFVKQIHNYGTQGRIFDLELITGSYEFSENGKLKVVASNDDFSGSSGGKKDTVNVFMDIKSRKTQVALLVTYINKNSLKLEVEWNRFEFKNDKNFELQDPVILTRQ